MTFAILSAVFWGTFGTIIKIMGGLGFQNITLVALPPTILAGVFLVKILLTSPKQLLVGWRLFLLMAVHGAILLAGENFFYIKAVALVPVGIVSIISFCHVIPLMVTTRIAFGYPITREKVGGSLVALLGISLILKIYQVGAASFNLWGILWASIVAITMALAYTLIKYYTTNGIHYQVYLFYTNFFAAFFFWLTIPPWGMVSETIVLASRHGTIVWFAVLGLALIPLTGAYVFFGKAYQYIEPTYVSIMFSLDPVTATMLGFLFFGESLSGMQLLGMIIVLIPLAYIQYREGNEPGPGGKSILDFRGKA